MADALELLVNTDQAKEYVDGRRQDLIDMIAERMDLVHQMFADTVKGNLSGGVLNTITGKLLSTVMQTPAQVSGDQVYGTVTAGGDEAPYGIYFEEGGTHSYDIVPVNARVLAFVSEGQQIFAKIVHHPPIPHLPWFGPEIPQAIDDMTTELNAGFAEVLST